MILNKNNNNLNKTMNIVIIGGTNGIGEALWRVLIEKQSTLAIPESSSINFFIVGRDKNKCTEIENYVKNLGRSDITLKCCSKDIAGGINNYKTSSDDIDKISEDILEMAKQHFKKRRIDMLFLNAGVLVTSPNGEMKDKLRNYLWNVNFIAIKSLFLTAIGEKSKKSFMKKNSKIIFTNSIEGLISLATPNNRFNQYSLAKKILHMQTEIWKKKYPKLNLIQIYPDGIKNTFWNIIDGISGERAYNKTRLGALSGRHESFLDFKSFDRFEQADKFLTEINQNKFNIFSCLETEKIYYSTQKNILLKNSPRLINMLYYTTLLTAHLTLFNLPQTIILDGKYNLRLLQEFINNDFYLETNKVTKQLQDKYISNC